MYSCLHVYLSWPKRAWESVYVSVCKRARESERERENVCVCECVSVVCVCVCVCVCHTHTCILWPKRVLCVCVCVINTCTQCCQKHHFDHGPLFKLLIPTLKLKTHAWFFDHPNYRQKLHHECVCAFFCNECMCICASIEGGEDP